MRKKVPINKMTPGIAIRVYCVSCCGGVSAEVKSCDGNGSNPAFHTCPFHPYRMGRGRPSVKVIRKFCIQCMNGRTDFVRECETINCLCHRYRMAKNPARRGKGYFADQTREKKSEKYPLNGGFAVQNRRSTAG